MLKKVRAALRAHVDEPFRRGATAFFREAVDMYGVRSPEVRAIARDAYAEAKGWPREDFDGFADALWRSGKIEECSIAIVLYRRLAKTCGVREFNLFESWIDRYVSNWANCDGVASWLLAASIANEPLLIGRLQRWTASPNRWKRRAAVVALLQEAKAGRNTGAIFAIADALLPDGDDMVQKGTGWVLKETYPKRPADVMRFLIARAANTPRLVLRLAAEKMTAKDRSALLGKPRTAVPV